MFVQIQSIYYDLGLNKRSVFGISSSDMTHQISGPCQGGLKRQDVGIHLASSEKPCCS